MKKNKKLLFSVLALSLLAQQAVAADVKVAETESKKKTEELNYNEEKESYGIFAVSGDAVNFFRSGALENAGNIEGGVTINAEDTRAEDATKSAVTADGIGNAVSATGYGTFDNKRDINKEIEGVQNSGNIKGNAKIHAGKAEVHGEMVTYATGNGISAYAVSDFGVDEGIAAGGVDGSAGGSRSLRAMRTFAVATEEADNDITYRPDPKDVVDPADQEGKNTRAAIATLHNTGSIQGEAELTTAEGWERPTTTIMNVPGIMQIQIRPSSFDRKWSFCYVINRISE